MNADNITNSLAPIKPINSKRIDFNGIYKNTNNFLAKLFVLRTRLYMSVFLELLLGYFVGICVNFKEPFYVLTINSLLDIDLMLRVYLSVLFVCFLLSFSVFGKVFTYIMFGTLSIAYGLFLPKYLLSGFDLISFRTVFLLVFHHFVLALFCVNCLSNTFEFGSGKWNRSLAKDFSFYLISCFVLITLLYTISAYIINDFVIG